jgi:hypothetical protein
VVVIRALTKTAKWAHRGFLGLVEARGKRAELISQLFLSPGDYLFHPSTDWRPAPGQSPAPIGGKGYPHDLRALRSFGPFLPAKTHFMEKLFFEEKLTPASRLVCAGSPKANKQTRLYLPSLELTASGIRQQYETLIPPESLKYNFGENPLEPRVKVISMMAGGEPELKTRKTIWKWRGKSDLGAWRPKGYDARAELTKDFLLVSRLPRTGAGGEVIVFAGGHGAGTEAVNLMLHKLSVEELRELADTLGGAPYYQFVVEVTKVKHRSWGTIPTRVRISEELPPERLDISAADLKKRPSKPEKEWR